MLQVNAQVPLHCPLHDAEQLPQPHHPYLQPVSASDHLLELPQVLIKPVCLLVLLVQHQVQDGEDDSVHQGGGNVPLDGYEHYV